VLIRTNKQSQHYLTTIKIISSTYLILEESNPPFKALENGTHDHMIHPHIETITRININNDNL